MTINLVKRVVGAATVAAVMSVSSVQAQSVGDEAYAVIQEWGDQFNANNAAGIADLYAPDAPFWRTAATELTNGAGAFAYFDGFTGIEGRENWIGAFHDPMIYTVDDNCVVIALVSSIDFGNGAVLRYRHMFTVARVDGEWLIVGHHSSPLVEPE